MVYGPQLITGGKNYFCRDFPMDFPIVSMVFLGISHGSPIVFSDPAAKLTSRDRAHCEAASGEGVGHHQAGHVLHVALAEIDGGFLSHRGTPSHHPFIDGFSLTKTNHFGYPHDYRNPQMIDGGFLLPVMPQFVNASCWCLAN